MRSVPIAALSLVLAFSAVYVSVDAKPVRPIKPARLGLCAACHGESGIAQLPEVPNLAGQRLDYLRKALKDYRDGSRKVAVMHAAVAPLSRADLDALARWYSGQDSASRNKVKPMDKSKP